MPPKPSAAALRRAATGNTSSSSQSRANGIISARENSRAVAWKARCSSESSKSMFRLVDLTRRPAGTRLMQGIMLEPDRPGNDAGERHANQIRPADRYETARGSNGGAGAGQRNNRSRSHGAAAPQP